MSMVKDAGKAMLQGREMPWSLHMLEARCAMGGSRLPNIPGSLDAKTIRPFEPSQFPRTCKRPTARSGTSCSKNSVP